jgi:hypothetical protein
MPTTIKDLRDHYDRFNAVDRDMIDGILELADSLRLLEGDVREIARKVDDGHGPAVTEGQPGCLSPEHRAEIAYNKMCNDPDIWLTHGMPSDDKAYRIKAIIAEAIWHAEVWKESKPAKDAPFRVNGEGTYRLRGGDLEVLKRSAFNRDELIGQTNGYSFRDGGDGQAFTSPSDLDLIAGPLPVAEQEIAAGISGWISVHPNGGISLCKDEAQAKRIAANGGKVYDLSELPASAVVTPAKKEARRIEGWINIYDHSGPQTGNQIFASKEGAHDCQPTAKKIACIRVSFAEGDGLEKEGA